MTPKPEANWDFLGSGEWRWEASHMLDVLIWSLYVNQWWVEQDPEKIKCAGLYLQICWLWCWIWDCWGLAVYWGMKIKDDRILITNWRSNTKTGRTLVALEGIVSPAAERFESRTSSQYWTKEAAELWNMKTFRFSMLRSGLYLWKNETLRPGDGNIWADVLEYLEFPVTLGPPRPAGMAYFSLLWAGCLI